MDRLIKFFHSRFFLAALGILLEFAQLIAVFTLLYEYFLPITVLGWIFHIGVLLYLLNRDEIPELKIPWLIILLLLPVIGAFIFMLLSSNETSKKEYMRYKEAAKEVAPYLGQTERVQTLREENADAFAQASYLYRTAGMPCLGQASTAYYRLGEDFYAALLEDLQQAKQFILMEYFIVEEGKMWDPIHAILREKAEQGISVYFLYDDFGCMLTLPERYYEQLSNEGIHCVPACKFRPILSHIHNNRDHRKITVIDGKVGYTGGVNLADEYINAVVKFGHWKDTAVRIEGEAVKNLTALFLVNYNMQGKESLDCSAFLEAEVSASLETGAVIPFGDAPSLIDTEDIGKNVYLNIIHAAKKYLYITTPYLICDHELLSALRIASQKGVDARLIAPYVPDKKLILLMTRSNYLGLIRAGVTIYEYTPGFIHAKNFVCDDQFAVCGTINLDYRSLVHHFECGAWMYRTECIADMKADFLDTAAVSEKITAETAALHWWERIPAELMKVFSVLL